MISPGEWLLNTLERDIEPSPIQDRPLMIWALNAGMIMMVALVFLGFWLGRR